MYVNGNDTIYFDSFRVEHNPKEIKKIMGNKIIQVYIYRIQSYDSIMYQYFCIEFLNSMLKNKRLEDFTDLFSPNNFFKK